MEVNNLYKINYNLIFKAYQNNHPKIFQTKNKTSISQFKNSMKKTSISQLKNSMKKILISQLKNSMINKKKKKNKKNKI